MRGKNYRRPKNRPYVRAEYIHGAPQPKISKFVIGNPNAAYTHRVVLISENEVQVRHNALEAARVAANKSIAESLSEDSYLLQVFPYPHIVLRENKMIATAGADRLQEGMRKSFGKPIGRAAILRPGQPVMQILVQEGGLEAAKRALKVAASKLPTNYRVLVEELEGAERAQAEPSIPAQGGAA
ncbi:MAG: 50S ribosomal protein L16 [Candidatus Bathyarchaeia archaeon]